ENRCNLVQKVCDLILSEDLDTEEAEHLAACLCHLFSHDLNIITSLLPLQVSPETIEESMGRPLCVLFDNLVTLPEDDHRRTPLLILLYEMRNISQQIGYHLLFFLKATSYRNSSEDQDTSALLAYRDLSKATGNKDFVGFIIKDLKLCSEDDPRVLSWIIPDMYHSFPKQTCGNTDLLQLLLERLDSSQLHDLVCMVLQGSLVMFDNSSFANILEKSLSWETVEQMFLWQLAKAHEIPVDCCLSVMPKLKFTSYAADVANTHGEALSNILMMLRRESPTEQLLRTLLLREFRLEDPTVVTILQYWVQRYEDKMAKLINDVVNNKPQPSPNKRKRAQSTKASAVPLDQVLSHLNHLRTACGGRTTCGGTTFFSLETMQDALQTAQNGCGDAQKKKYSDLFALIEEEEEEPQPEPQRKTGRGKSARKTTKGRKKAETESEEGTSEEEEEPEPQRKAKSNRGRKPKGRKKQESESEEGSSEEEEVGKRPRKRKKNNQVGSDSE
ncbi:unnamed protein product, partial [Meganyctiphanes norvegica]